MSGKLDRVEIAQPCPVKWEDMQGDGERVRFCGQCQLNVYNLSAMTRREAERLLSESEGRLCGQLYRRVDGTVATRRPLREMISRRAAVAYTSLLGWTFATIARAEEVGTIRGRVTDASTSVVPGAVVTIASSEIKRVGKTGPDGHYEFTDLAPGLYSLRVEVPGFKTFVREVAVRGGGDPQTLNATLEVGSVGQVIEVQAIPSLVPAEIRKPRRFLGIFRRG